MRLIDADVLINDLEHDIAIDEDILAYVGTDQITRATTQFDKDCKQNAIDLLMSAPTIDIPHGDDWEAYSERLWKNAYERGKADRPQGDFVSKRYLLAEIDDLADEFSEVDENGLHSERWCGILDSRGIIVNAPSVLDRPQGEWVLSSDGYGYIGNPVYKCSVCGWWDEQTPYNFCPNCGADMREREGE